MQCHTIKIGKKLSIYNRRICLITIAMGSMKSIKGINKLSYKRRYSPIFLIKPRIFWALTLSNNSCKEEALKYMKNER